MSDFKVIYRADIKSDNSNGITWEIGCPLLFEAIQISRNTESGQAFLQGKLRNITDGVAKSFRASIIVDYDDGTTEDVSFNPLDADIDAGTLYELKPALLRSGNAVKATGVIESVKLQDSDWTSSSEPTPLPKPKQIGLSEAALEERYKKIWYPLIDSLQPKIWYLLIDSYPPINSLQPKRKKEPASNHLETGDGWWLCPCGQVNVSRANCLNCGVSLKILKMPEMEDENALIQAAKKRVEAKAKSKERNKKIALKVRKIAISIAIAIIALILIINLAIIPPIKHNAYDRATSEYDAGNYEAAYESFMKADDYSDAAERAAESKRLYDFYTNLQPFLQDRPLDAYYFEHKVEEGGYGKECTMTLNSDLSVVLHIPKSISKYGSWSETFSFYSGDWEGAIDPTAEQLTLPSYPGGKTWDISFPGNSLTVAKIRFENGDITGYSRAFYIEVERTLD